MEASPLWAIMPVVSGQDMTVAAISDLLAQTVPLQILVVNQGVDDDFRQQLERIAEEHPQVMLWHHEPRLPSLSATWNRALDAAWQAGCDNAFVVNNDLRLHPRTVAGLMGAMTVAEAYFVSAVGVTPTQFEGELWHTLYWYDEAKREVVDRGGPDFSCFLVSREGHEKYRFDEGFIPAYGEDCSMHREYMLGGDGRKIFSVNLPFLHYASGTLKSLNPKARATLERQIGGSREYYKRKWGDGGINHETYLIPFSETSARESVTNPELQALVATGGDVRTLVEEARAAAPASRPDPVPRDQDPVRG